VDSPERQNIRDCSKNETYTKHPYKIIYGEVDPDASDSSEEACRDIEQISDEMHESYNSQ
jgi:hypothetical protein